MRLADNNIIFRSPTELVLQDTRSSRLWFIHECNAWRYILASTTTSLCRHHPHPRNDRILCRLSPCQLPIQTLHWPSQSKALPRRRDFSYASSSKPLQFSILYSLRTVPQAPPPSPPRPPHVISCARHTFQRDWPHYSVDGLIEIIPEHQLPKGGRPHDSSDGLIEFVSER